MYLPYHLFGRNKKLGDLYLFVSDSYPLYDDSTHFVWL